MKILLEHGVDVRSNDNAALIVAAMCGETKTVKLLLSQGTDVHANEDSALRWAAETQHYRATFKTWRKISRGKTAELATQFSAQGRR